MLVRPNVCSELLSSKCGVGGFIFVRARGNKRFSPYFWYTITSHQLNVQRLLIIWDAPILNPWHPVCLEYSNACVLLAIIAAGIIPFLVKVALFAGEKPTYIAPSRQHKDRIQ